MEPAPIVVPAPAGERAGVGVSIKTWEKEYEIILRCRFRGRIQNSSRKYSVKRKLYSTLTFSRRLLTNWWTWNFPHNNAITTRCTFASANRYSLHSVTVQWNSSLSINNLRPFTLPPLRKSPHPSTFDWSAPLSGYFFVEVGTFYVSKLAL